jgi:chromosome segregation ATPase
MKAQDFNEGIVDGSFTEEICELKSTQSRIEEELGRIRSRLDDSLRECHTLRAETNELRHDLQVLQSQNKNLHDELVQKTVGIAGAIQTLSSLQTERIEITPDTHGTQSPAIGMLSVAGEV